MTVEHEKIIEHNSQTALLIFRLGKNRRISGSQIGTKKLRYFSKAHIEKNIVFF